MSGLIGATCPRCSFGLQRHSMRGLSVFRCAACEGTALTIPSLRKTSKKQGFQSFMAGWRSAQTPGPLACPMCSKPMPAFQLEDTGGHSLVIDACKPCQVVWLDQGEQARMGALPDDTPPRPELAEADRLLLQAKLDSQAERHRIQTQADRSRGGLDGGVVLVELLFEIVSVFT